MLSNKAKNIILKPEVRAEFPFLIAVTHIANDGTETIYRYANSDKSIFFEDEEFEPAVFSITPPEISSTSIGNATLTMSSIDQTWIEKIRNTQKRCKVRFIGTIVYDDVGSTVVEPIFDNDFLLTECQWNEMSITWTMVFDDKWGINVPSQICDTINTPGVA